MNLDEAVERLNNVITCEKCHISGKECDDNCPTQYKAGTVGECVEALETVLNRVVVGIKGRNKMIYVYENDVCEEPSREKIKYKSEHIPRVGEILHFPHLGGFKVNDVVYRMSDDRETNTIMWVEVYVEKFKGENKR